MRKLLVLALVGLAAQLVDGALGMGYGVTSTSLLVLAGLTPVAASASVHFSELGTNVASGVAHWRLQNVDWRIVARIAGPGAVGAFLGATVLSSLSTEAAQPVMSGILVALGIYILTRFILGVRLRLTTARPGLKFLAPLGMFAGFVDATGGGGWGPVATPALLADGRLEPRKVIGTVDTSEFAVSAAASIGFLIGLGASGINWGFALALLVGGVIAAPLAAYLVKVAPAHLLGVAVGGVILLTNARTLFRAYDVAEPIRIVSYVAVLLVTVVGLHVAGLRARRTAAVERQTDAAESATSPQPVTEGTHA